jgi:hypothetical protein
MTDDLFFTICIAIMIIAIISYYLGRIDERDEFRGCVKRDKRTGRLVGDKRG